MKLILAACLLVLTECKQAKRQFEGICNDAVDPTSELFACVAGFSSGSSLACEENCRSLLDQYADACLLGGSNVFKTNVENFCNTDVDPSLPTSDVCIESVNPNSEISSCLLEYAQLSSTACDEKCRSELEDYADECLSTGADLYKNQLNDFCETVDPSDNPTDDSTDNPTDDFY